ncbi:MAG: hypothetical protein QM718_12915 [Steroidobacteraceae bacterium]
MAADPADRQRFGRIPGIDLGGFPGGPESASGRCRPVRLISLVLWKLLASSTHAIAGALETMATRLQGVLENTKAVPDLADELDRDYESLDETLDEWGVQDAEAPVPTQSQRDDVSEEIDELRRFKALATSIRDNAKGKALLIALDRAFAELERLGAARKAIIFTESRRTQDYLLGLLADKLAQDLRVHIEAQRKFSANLNEPQQQFEIYQRQLAEWNSKREELVGSPTEPESKVGIETRIEQIKVLPDQLKELEVRRLKLSCEIFDTLDSQRKARADLFKPVQDLIQKDGLIGEGYQLQFQATLAASSEAIADQLFALIKQQWGGFRGQDDALSNIKKLFDSHDLNTKDGALAFVAALQGKVLEAGKAAGSEPGIFNLLKKGQSAGTVYDLIFGLNFLEPRYSLLFQDTQIEQLSPGQRGALLLIFYLLVDKGKTPIILDQPEENLDNETVFRLLVADRSESH